MQVDRAALKRAVNLGDVGEHHPGAPRVHPLPGHVVEAEHDVLGRHDDRLAVRRRQDVVGRHHQGPRLELGFDRQRNVDRHLVAVEVRVERGAHEGMELYRLAFDQNRLERLDAEPVQRRRAVQQHRVLANDLFENVPHLRSLALHELLRGLDRGRETAQLELAEDEGLEQLERHLLRQSALVELQGRADDDDGAPRIVDPLAEQILSEPALLALDHVGERLQRTLVRSGDRSSAAPVVEQGVDRLLEHALFVAHDDVGRVEGEKPLQTIVAIDDPAIQVVEIGGRETSAIERHQRAQLRRQHRQHAHHHPLGLVAGTLERLHELEPLRELLDLRLRTGLRQLLPQQDDLAVEVDGAQQVVDCLGAHLRLEVVAVLLDGVEVHVVRQQLAPFEVRHSRVDDDERLEVENPLDVAQRHVQQQPHARRQRLQVPDMRDRARELDVSHALATNFRQGDLDAALLADDAPMLQALVLAAQAFVVLDRPEDLCAKQSVALGLERTVVDGLRLLDLAIGPRPDLVRRRESDSNRVEPFDLTLLLQQIE